MSSLTDSLFNSFINHLSQPNVKHQLKTKLLMPIIQDINDRYYYHFLGVVCLLVIIIVLLLMILNKIK